MKTHPYTDKNPMPPAEELDELDELDELAELIRANGLLPGKGLALRARAKGYLVTVTPARGQKYKINIATPESFIAPYPLPRSEVMGFLADTLPQGVAFTWTLEKEN